MPNNRSKPFLSSDDLPDYADSGNGFPVFRGPYLQKDVNLNAFIFHANIDNLTVLCDETLNSVKSSPYKYIPLTSNVVVVYADMLAASLDERDSQIGLIPETEVGFWVLTVAMKGHVPHHLAWFLPYLLVDESNSIATGREVYGFNKQAGEFHKPQGKPSPQFTVDVLGIKKFDPASIAHKERLLDLNSVSTEVPQSKWKDWNSAKNEIIGELIGSIRPDYAGGILEFAAHALTDHIPLVFLKQFRHVVNSKKACYKTIVEASLKVNGFYGGGFLSQACILKLNHLDSHPFARKLGLKGEQISTLNAWIKVDFVLDHGVEL